MHYQNGRKAKIGDVVMGKGYNFKHDIIGVLVDANPGADTCNCTISCVARHADPAYKPPMTAPAYFDNGVPTIGGVPRVESVFEYGQLDAFVALDPKTGDILLPEEGDSISPSGTAALTPAPPVASGTASKPAE